MQKKSTLWLILLLSVVLSLVAACGSNTPTSHTTVAPKVPAEENIYVLDGYAPSGNISTNQRIVAFHPGSANPATLVSLPAGLTSADHRRLYTAVPNGITTTISIIDTQSGKTIRSFSIPGNYSTAGQSYAYSVMSPDGKWLALRQIGQTQDQSTFALINTQAGKGQIIQLSGDFDLDAVNPDGSRLYLLQRLNDATGHYYVRLYDVLGQRLYPDRIADKSEINDPRMTGSALTRQMSSDGKFAYTLYIDTPRNIAFLHVLPLTGDLLFARCIDLPAGRSADLLHYYTLTLSSDGSTLYAANGALGIVSKISLDSGVIFNDQITLTNKFNPGDASVTSSDKTRLLHNGAVLSPDQKTLYFTGMHGIWAVDTSDLHTQGNFLTQQSFTSIALSADGRTLYAVDPANGITLLNAATGQLQQVIQGPAHTPWGIEWINN